jgi:hypothetical protein
MTGAVRRRPEALSNNPKVLTFMDDARGWQMAINITPVEARSGELQGILLPILLCGLMLVTIGMISLFTLMG